MKYYAHGSAGENLYFSTTNLNKAKAYANAFNSLVTISTLHNGISCWNGKPCKIFKKVYSNKIDLDTLYHYERLDNL